MAVSVEAPSVGYSGVDLVHVFKAPVASTYSLGHRKKLHPWSTFRPPLIQREENWYQGKTYAILVIMLLSHNVVQIIDALKVSSISLVEQAVDEPMELTLGTGCCPEVEGDVKSSVSCCFNQNELS